MIAASPLLILAFAAMALTLAIGAIAAVRFSTAIAEPETKRRAHLVIAIIVAWLLFTGLAAARGVFTFGAMPPRMMVAMVLALMLSLAFVYSRVGLAVARRVPLALLVAWQGFRLPLELFMHRAYREGLMPVQMSYSGYNFDILTGAAALVVAFLLVKRLVGTALVTVWNVAGLILLLNIMTIAVLSTPTPLRAFHNAPANTWITAFPFAWLPLLMVPTALIGHLLIFRRLAFDRVKVPA